MPNEMLQEIEQVEQTRQMVRDDFNELVKSTVSMGEHIRKENRRANYVSLAMLMMMALIITLLSMQGFVDLNAFAGKLVFCVSSICFAIFLVMYVQTFDTWKLPIFRRVMYTLLQVGEPQSLRHKQDIFKKMTTLIWETGPVLVEQGHISELKWQAVQLELSQFAI